MPRPRWYLSVQARFWRTLMAIGMFIHRLPAPRPPSPSFARVIPTVISPKKGSVNIQFYVPKDYYMRKTLQKRKYPVVVNFHGGGFTIGSAKDDARWAGALIEHCGAIVASVDYRLAPEHFFPTAVEDGVDSIMYIVKHAEELWIDTNNIAVSGFSAGGNMAFTVPLRLQEELDPEYAAGSKATPSPVKALDEATTVVRSVKQINLAAIVSWYPSTDYTQTREQRRETLKRKDQELSAVFTELFDESYLQPPTMNKEDPYLSPGLAPKDMLNNLPDNIILFTCEFDVLLAEAERLKIRLEELGKRVKYHMVPGVPHAWDKAPNPMSETAGVREHYLDACKELNQIFIGRVRQENESAGGSSTMIDVDSAASSS